MEKKINLQDFTESEQVCISSKISKLLDEGKDQDQAVAIAISMCAPEKSKSQLQNDIDLGGKFTAHQNFNGAWSILDVPIFVEHSVKIDGKEFHLGKDWMTKAKARQTARLENDAYLPPLHIHHHDLGKETVPAGVWKIKEVKKGTYQGKDLFITFADFLNIPNEVYQKIRQGLLPYRSVEIHDIFEPEIDSLSLLDTEVPFFRLPLLTIGNEIPQRGMNVGPVQKLKNSFMPAYRQIDKGALCLFYMEGEQVMFEKIHPKAGEKFMEDEKKEKEKEEKAQDGDAMKKAIEGLKAVSAQIASIAEMLMGGESVETPAESEKEASPTPVEMEEKKEEEKKEEMAAQNTAKENHGSSYSLEKLTAELDAMKTERKKEQVILDATKKLIRYGLDETMLDKRLNDLWEKGGEKSIDAYYLAIKENLKDDPKDLLIDSSLESSKDVFQYASLGQKAVESASKYSKEYDEMKRAGLNFSYPKNVYISENLKSEGFQVETLKEGGK